VKRRLLHRLRAGNESNRNGNNREDFHDVIGRQGYYYTTHCIQDAALRSRIENSVYDNMAGSLVSSPRKHRHPYGREHEDSHSKSECDDAHPALLKFQRFQLWRANIANFLHRLLGDKTKPYMKIRRSLTRHDARRFSIKATRQNGITI
jgi:hypothetical protein